MGAEQGLLQWDLDGRPLSAAGTGVMRRLAYDPRGDFLVGITESGSLQVFDLRAVEAGTWVDDPAVER